jgi:hypothetical protein
MDGVSSSGREFGVLRVSSLGLKRAARGRSITRIQVAYRNGLATPIRTRRAASDFNQFVMTVRS